MTKVKRISQKQNTVFFLLVLIIASIFCPFKIRSEVDDKIVRIGWHEGPYFITDEYDRWSGYTYEYQRKIAAYTGWKYDYVKGSFSELLQMLKDGQIDMMGNISYTEERMFNVLNNKVFVDALTSVRNKGAFDNFVQDLQDRLDNGEVFDFAIGVFDCDDLKSVNDEHGHDKSDIYLKTASRLICEIFKHSAVFRIGGDEFAVIVENEDFNHLDTLIEEFRIAEQEICKSASNSWEQVHIALGIAKYDPVLDHSVNDTARRADKIMYENKRLGKEGR